MDIPTYMNDQAVRSTRSQGRDLERDGRKSNPTIHEKDAEVEGEFQYFL